jgi:hypothetical protein
VSESDIFLQETFLNLLKNWGDFSRYHQFINPGFKIGRDWINSMRDKMS